jgi:muramoyltetrapeptide carboxypeptidase
MVAKDWAHDGGVDLASWQAALAGGAAWEPELGAASGAVGLVEGSAEGILYGGCLSILVASLGTPYEIRTEGTILFIEDVAAKPYQIDRMLMQLKLAGKLEEVRGIVFGEMRECLQTANQGYTLEEVILRIVGELGMPVAFGVRSGHVTAGNITLPIGVRAGLSVSGGRVRVQILEKAVAG